MPQSLREDPGVFSLAAMFGDAESKYDTFAARPGFDTPHLPRIIAEQYSIELSG